MALVLNDRVQETCSAPGTGAVTLLGAVTGFQPFSSGVGNGNTCYYCIADQGGANWEVGLGTYASSGNTLTRTTPYAGSATTPVNFSSGVQTVFVTYPAEKKVILDASGNTTALGTVSSGTWQGTAVGIAYGGTGQTTASDAFNALSPITTAGDLIVGAGTNSASRLAIGASGYFLKSNGTTATWEAGPSASYVRTAFTATAGQTTFSVSYTPNQVEVFMNGVLLNAADYTASNGTSVALTVAASAGDIVEVIAYNVITTSTTDANNLVGGSGGYVPYQSAPGVTSFVSAGTSGQALVSNGTSAPSWGAVGTSAGGTGLSSFTANGVLYASSTSALSTGSALTFDGTNLGIGTSSPAAKLDVTGGTIRQQVFGASGLFDSYVAEGTSASPTALASNRQVYGLRAFGYDGTSYLLAGGIDVQAESNWSVGTTPSYLRFRTRTSGGSVNEAMRIDSSGNIIAQTGSIQEHKSALAANDISLSTGNYFSKTISGTTAFTVSNVPTTGTAISFILDLTNGGSATINWWTGVKWPGGTAPTLTTSGRDVLGFFTYDGGTTWTGLILGKDVK